MTTHDSLKWNEWLDTIYKDVQNLLTNRYIFREVQKIISSNPRIQIGSSFYDWMGSVYAASQVIGVRRQVDADSDSISFRNLLDEIRQHAHILSRERYVSLYKDSGLPNDIPHRDFDRKAGTGRNHIDPVVVEADLSALQEKAERIRKYVNKRIAHFDRAEFKSLPTYAELDECLDYLEALLKKYLSLLQAKTHLSIVPVWQYDWKEIFRRPWIEK